MDPKFSKAPWLKVNALEVVEPKLKLPTLSAMPDIQDEDQNKRKCISITTLAGTPVAEVEYSPNMEENANLIKMAPELYKQLTWAYTMLLSGKKVRLNDPDMKKTSQVLQAVLDDDEPPTEEQVKVLREYIDHVRSQECSDNPYGYEDRRIELHEKILMLYGFFTHTQTSEVTSSITPADTPYTIHKKLLALKRGRNEHYGYTTDAEGFEE